MKRGTLIMLMMYGFAIAAPLHAAEQEGQKRPSGTQQEAKKPTEDSKSADQAEEEKKKKKSDKKEGGDSEPGCD